MGGRTVDWLGREPLPPIPQPVLMPIFDAGGMAYQLARAYGFWFQGVYYEIPMGFICDGASVPALARVIIERDGLHRAGYLPHDYFYGSKLLPKALADLCFDERNRAALVAAWKCRLMYLGVKWFGNPAHSKPLRIEPPRYVIT